MLAPLLGNVLGNLFFILVVGCLSAVIIHLVKPLLLMGRGVIRDPAGVLQLGSLLLHYFRATRVIWPYQLLSIITLALLTSLFSILPIYGSTPVYFARPDLVLICSYILSRLIWVLGTSLCKNKISSEMRLEVPIAASLILVIVFSVIGSLNGGGSVFENITLHLTVFTSFGSFLSFLLLLLGSKIFFLAKPETGLGGAFNSMTLPYYISKVFWFSLLVWMYFGAIDGALIKSFLFFLALTTLFLVFYEILNEFLSQISSKSQDWLMVRVVLPGLLVSTMITWIELWVL